MIYAYKKNVEELNLYIESIFFKELLLSGLQTTDAKNKYFAIFVSAYVSDELSNGLSGSIAVFSEYFWSKRPLTLSVWYMPTDF